jgi:hypothetical protein
VGPDRVLPQAEKKIEVKRLFFVGGFQFREAERLVISRKASFCKLDVENLSCRKMLWHHGNPRKGRRGTQLNDTRHNDALPNGLN